MHERTARTFRACYQGDHVHVGAASCTRAFVVAGYHTGGQLQKRNHVHVRCGDARVGAALIVDPDHNVGVMSVAESRWARRISSLGTDTASVGVDQRSVLGKGRSSGIRGATVDWDGFSELVPRENRDASRGHMYAYRRVGPRYQMIHKKKKNSILNF